MLTAVLIAAYCIIGVLVIAASDYAKAR